MSLSELLRVRRDLCSVLFTLETSVVGASVAEVSVYKTKEAIEDALEKLTVVLDILSPEVIKVKTIFTLVSSVVLVPRVCSRACYH
jgi:hypothetical protein